MRYEFRAWGDWEHLRAKLADLATGQRHQRLHDCYLLVPASRLCAKIRKDQLKLKRLVEEESGFQRWASTWYENAERAPKPFRSFLRELAQRDHDEMDRSWLREVAGEIGPKLDVHPVFVTKDRDRFRLGPIRAELTQVTFQNQAGRLSTIAIEGPDIGHLKPLRSLLHLSHMPNVSFLEAVASSKSAH